MQPHLSAGNRLNVALVEGNMSELFYRSTLGNGDAWATPNLTFGHKSYQRKPRENCKLGGFFGLLWLM